MTCKLASAARLLCISTSLMAGVAHADAPIRNWWQDSGRDPNWGKPCQIQLETRQATFTKVVKCAKGVETPWVGPWKDEFRDGPCNVKLVATRDVFKAEVKCPPR